MTSRATPFLTRLALVEHAEWPLVFGAFTYFFCLLCGYYLLRPVRDEMGIQAGLGNLPWLFTATLVAMLVATPVFGWLSSRLPRRTLLPLVYGFFALNLGVFYLCFAKGIGLAMVAKMFFVWVSVFNLFVVSVFWSFMADLFTTAQAKRVNGIIAAGGSTGALAGPLLATLLAEHLGVARLLLLSSGFLIGAIGCLVFLAQRAQAQSPQSKPDRRLLGGGVWEGVTLVLKSRNLLAICAFVLLYSMLSTFLYFQQQNIVAASLADPAARTALFAKMDLATNSLTLVVQVFLFNRLIKWSGLTIGLVCIPLLSVVGFLALALEPALWVLVVFGVTRRAGEFALAKPARETLFNGLKSAEKYKAKNFMDTAVYRSGDAASAWIFEGLRGLGLNGIAILGALGAIVWAWLGRWLVTRHSRPDFSRG